MCGIIAVLKRRSGRPAPDRAALVGGMEAALRHLSAPETPLVERLHSAGEHLGEVNALLKGTPGATALVTEPALAGELEDLAARIAGKVEELDSRIDATPGTVSPDELERVNAGLVDVKDRLWAVQHDRLGTARELASLAGQNPSCSAIESYGSIQTALAAIDRLEVRGRDSAGVHVLVWDHGLDLDEPSVAKLIARRDDPLFTSGVVRTAPGALGFVYKAAAEIGELGDNVAAIRRGILNDQLLRKALQSESARATVLGHTRWASVGTISEANAHPLDGLEEDRPALDAPHLVAVLNGDIDNYPTLVSQQSLDIAAVITTDAKVIPVLASRRIGAGEPLDDAFAATMAELEGSMAIVASSAIAPEKLHLAVRGSGQGLYVGLAEDAFVVASEPYGVIEEAESYLRIDGDNTAGRLVILDANGAGTVEGIDRRGYDGRVVEVTDEDLQYPEITTRDIDRRGFPHFLLKEITEAPESFRKTLRGRVVERDGALEVLLDAKALPDSLREGLKEGRYRRVIVIGQGTAAVAGQSVAGAVEDALAPLDVTVTATTASELSGFGLADDMQDTVVIAISQSGTTTDTNRTVDMVTARGAAVVAIVNRRNTELAEKSHGVVHTSDGRDLEMSVASTKAFYAQVAAGFLLALAMADAAGCGDRTKSSALLGSLLDLPDAMGEVLDMRDQIAGIAGRHAARRRYWAVVGSGPNRVAAAEVRIKLSELCYKSVACDSIEDKKHIDLSAEPMILVCAAGLEGSNATDVQKEIAIYRAHKAAPIVVATRGQKAFDSVDSILVPSVHPRVDFVLSAMAGHLFGYEAALTIDSWALPLREIRAAIQELASAGLTAGSVLLHLGPRVKPSARKFLEAVSDGGCDGVMNLGPAMRLGILLRCAIGDLPFETYEMERGSGAGPRAFLDELVTVLTQAIDDLTRSIDAVKHQAKTVTVGISRSEEGLFGVPLVKEVMRVGAGTELLGYRTLRTLAALDPAVERITGFTRYVVEGDVRSGRATIHVRDRGGVAAEMRSRTETDPRLRGTKRAALEKAEVEVTVGRSDGRPVILIPERKGDVPQGLTLLHVKFRDRLPAETARDVLLGYRPARYEGLVAAVTETEDTFAEEILAGLSMPELLVEPVLELAERWRTPA
ncbi:MAG TPA: SIS domain-containing protein [Actinomycetota bacterium]|nr:SIS domain-containing protein [Actinomycetota bacterium]